MKGMRTIILAAIMAAMATFILIVLRTNVRLHDENVALGDRLAKLEAQSAPPTTAPTTNATDNLSSEQMSELLRLRSQVGALKRQAAEVKSTSPRTTAAAPQSVDPADKAKQDAMMTIQALAKMNTSRNWMMAFVLYAGDHGGQMPTSFDQAMGYLGEDHKSETLLTTNVFEIVYQGTRDGIANPSSTIVLRETTPNQSADGSYFKAYGFSDGHSEIHKFVDGNIADWEAARIVKPPGQ